MGKLVVKSFDGIGVVDVQAPEGYEIYSFEATPLGYQLGCVKKRESALYQQGVVESEYTVFYDSQGVKIFAVTNNKV